jgi:hypothetical protein
MHRDYFYPFSRGENAEIEGDAALALGLKQGRGAS